MLSFFLGRDEFWIQKKKKKASRRERNFEQTRQINIRPLIHDISLLKEISSDLGSITNLTVTRWYNGKYTSNLPDIDTTDNELSKLTVQISKASEQIQLFMDKHQLEWQGIKVEAKVSEIKEKLNALITALSYPPNMHSNNRRTLISTLYEPTKSDLQALLDSAFEALKALWVTGCNGAFTRKKDHSSRSL